MGCCNNKEQTKKNISTNQGQQIVNQLDIIKNSQGNFQQPQDKPQDNFQQPQDIIQQPKEIIKQLPDSPLIKKSKITQYDIREIDLLQKSAASIKSNSSIIELFEQKIEELEKEQNQFIKSKQSIETQLIQSFVSEENQLQDYKQNSQFIGVRITNRNICDIDNKYDFSQVDQFTEYQEQIKIVRLIQKQKSSVCTYLGKIDQKYCCVKLIPMAKKIHIDEWITSIKNAQSSTDEIIKKYFQKYYYYKIEIIIDQPQYCNCFIISNLEQFNIYTFSHHSQVTFQEKAQVAPDIIQIIWFALNSKLEQDQYDQNKEKVSAQIFKTILTVKRNNILISRLQNQKGKLKVILSDWQLLLPEFEHIIPNKKLQNQDQFYEKVQQQICQIIESNNINIQPGAQNSQNIPPGAQNSQNIKQLLTDEFSKYFMKLLFFRSNFELHEDLSLDGFFNENEFKSKCQELRTIQNNDQILQEKIEKQIKEKLDIQYEPDQIEFINKMSQEMSKLFQLNPEQNMKSLYEFYLIINKLPCEDMRSRFSFYNEKISKNNINQSIKQDQ